MTPIDQSFGRPPNFDAAAELELSLARLPRATAVEVLLQTDLDHDGKDEVVLWRVLYGNDSLVYAQSQGQWRRIGYLTAGEERNPDSLRAELATGAYATQVSRWDALRIGKTRFQVFEKAE